MMNPSRARRMIALLRILAAPDPSGALLGEYELVIEEKPMNMTGGEKLVPQINGSVPGSVLRWREGRGRHDPRADSLGLPTSLHAIRRGLIEAAKDLTIFSDHPLGFHGDSPRPLKRIALRNVSSDVQLRGDSPPPLKPEVRSCAG